MKKRKRKKAAEKEKQKTDKEFTPLVSEGQCGWPKEKARVRWPDLRGKGGFLCYYIAMGMRERGTKRPDYALRRFNPRKRLKIQWAVLDRASRSGTKPKAGLGLGVKFEKAWRENCTFRKSFLDWFFRIY